MNAANVKSLLINVYYDFKRGDISESQATKEASILNSILKAIEVTDLEKKLIEIERVIRE